MNFKTLYERTEQAWWDMVEGFIDEWVDADTELELGPFLRDKFDEFYGEP